MKIALSPLIGDARGSAGDLTFTQTRAGLVALVKTSPFQPLTQAQFLERALLATVSQTWKSAPMNAYRAAWIILAANNPYDDIFHVPHKLTGSAMFTKLNRNLQTLGLSVLFLAPSTLSCGAPGLLAITHDAGPPEDFTVQPSTQPMSTEAVIIRATPPLSPGRQTLSNSQTIIQTFTAGTAGPWDIFTKYKAKHSTVATGLQVFVLVNYVETTTGYAGQQSINSVIW